MSREKFGGGRRPPPDDVRSWGREGGARGTGQATIPNPVPGGSPIPVSAGSPFGGPRFAIQSPYVVRPPFAVDFKDQGDQAARTAVNSPTVLATFQTPTESVGVIRSIVLTVNNLLLTSDIFWSLLFNGSGVPGWQNLAVTPGAVPYFALSYGPDETYIRVPEGTRVDLSFTVNAGDAAAYLAGAQFSGWYFPKQMAFQVEELYR